MAGIQLPDFLIAVFSRSFVHKFQSNNNIYFWNIIFCNKKYFLIANTNINRGSQEMRLHINSEQ